MIETVHNLPSVNTLVDHTVSIKVVTLFIAKIAVLLFFGRETPIKRSMSWPIPQRQRLESDFEVTVLEWHSCRRKSQQSDVSNVVKAPAAARLRCRQPQPPGSDPLHPHLGATEGMQAPLAKAIYR